jgi:hypothetical protein
VSRTADDTLLITIDTFDGKRIPLRVSRAVAAALWRELGAQLGQMAAQAEQGDD